MKTKLLLLISAIALSSCITQKKQLRIAKEYMNDNPTELAKLCAVHFPVQDNFIQGEPIVEIREEVRTDTVTVHLEGKTIKIPCPECKQQIKTVTVRDTIIRKDKAHENVLSLQISQFKEKNAVLNAKNDSLSKEKKRYKVASISLSGLIVLLMFLWVKIK